MGRQQARARSKARGIIGRIPASRANGANWFDRVARLATDLWWTWNTAAQGLFASLDPVLWRACRQNPVRLLAELPVERRALLAQDATVNQMLADVERAHAEYVRAGTWYRRVAKGAHKRMQVAYFCAEYALHECLPIYAGGLGVLAGDHLKSASDLGVPLTAIGLLYRNAYYTQRLAPDGSTIVEYPQLDFENLPIQDTGKRIRVAIGRTKAVVRIWRAQVGRVALYLLDTDHDANPPEIRAVTHHLYGGDNEMRIQQEILLGTGGLQALQALGARPTVLHLNEGHAAFAALELLRQQIAAGKSFKAAMRAVAAQTVFTTHTPVPAGHDRFGFDLMDKYFRASPRQLGVRRDEFLALGREAPDAQSFCMTALALRLSSRRNGVSALNGEVSRHMWAELLAFDRHAAPVRTARTTSTARPSISDFEAPNPSIGHVTNGIHPQTWLAPEAEALYEKYLQPKWVGAGPEDDWWKNAHRIPRAELWELRGTLRRKLLHFVRSRLVHQAEQRGGERSSNVGGQDVGAARSVWRWFDPEALTIGFARRFATYKRAPLIFHDADRLAAILNDARRPVQLLFAGKAHPRDREGQQYAQMVFEFAADPRFRERVALIENYDMEVGRMLTSGCDVWLNNPLRPREASGTSGMKPPLHGGLNCSILDGWWPEAYNAENGWAIGSDEATHGRNDIGGGDGAGGDPDEVDARDAAAIYNLLESEIVPLFYERDEDGIPQGWAQRMINGMQTICAQFSTHRMLADYVRGYYWK